MRKLISRTAFLSLVGATAFGTIEQRQAAAQQLIPTSGTVAWNDDANWGQPFPNGAGASAIVSAPTGHLIVDLSQPITLDALTINKGTAATNNFDTTVRGSATNTLTFTGAALISNDYTAEGTGWSYIDAPVIFNSTLTITQKDDEAIRFYQPLSGAGGLLVNRTASGEGTVRFVAANSYAGPTVIAGNGSTTFAVVRLEDANSIPGGIDATGGTSNITLKDSAILGLNGSDFKRNFGAGPDQIQFSGGQNGFAAFTTDRAVNIGGNLQEVNWGTAGLGTFVLGAVNATATVDFQNPLNLGSSNRSVRLNDGGAAVDGRISGVISATGTGTFTKLGAGTLALAAANTYAGNTIINNGGLRLEKANAIPATSNLTISGNGHLQLAVADYAANLGTGAGQVQFTTGGGGFSASNGTWKVTLNGGAGLTWGAGNFIAAGNNFILSDDSSADGTVDFTNPINLAGAARTVATRAGAADIDAKLSGVISGAGSGSSFVKNQQGTLELSAANTYEGPTQIANGVLLLTNQNSIPGGVTGGNIANINLSGNNGVIALGANDFTSGIGTGAGQVQFGSGVNVGFAAYGATRNVNLGGASQQVVWNGGFISGKFLVGTAGADATVVFQNPIDLNGGARSFLARNGHAPIAGEISNVISGAGGSVVKEGNGHLALTAANTYDGGTSIIAGRLYANNTTGSAVGSGDVTVSGTGTLAGTGFVGTAGDASNVAVQTGGRINPGVAIGQLTVSGNVTFATGSFFDVDLDGGGFDKLTVNGATSLEGTLNVVVPTGFTATPGTTYSILSSTGGVSGQFAAITTNGTNAWTAQYDANGVTLIAGALPSNYAADFDLDGDVDGDDLTRWQTNYGLASGGTKATGDANGDGIVDGADFLSWQREFGSGVTPPASPATAAVPEPASGVIGLAAVLGALPLIRKFRRPRSFRRNEQ
jgi:autotransporter-associated beta strand protein